MDDEILGQEYEKNISYKPDTKQVPTDDFEKNKKAIDKKLLSTDIYYPTGNRRNKTLIILMIIFIIALWILSACLLIFGEKKFYNAMAYTSGNGDVSWYVEGKSTTKFLTSEDIVAGVIYSLDMSVKNSSRYASSLRVKIEMTCKGEEITEYNMVGIDSDRFSYDGEWFYYKNGTDDLLPADSGQRFATGIKLGNQFRDLDYKNFRLHLILEAYKGTHDWNQ